MPKKIYRTDDFSDDRSEVTVGEMVRNMLDEAESNQADGYIETISRVMEMQNSILVALCENISPDDPRAAAIAGLLYSRHEIEDQA